MSGGATPSVISLAGIIVMTRFSVIDVGLPQAGRFVARRVAGEILSPKRTRGERTTSNRRALASDGERRRATIYAA
jgi:hypothetical protein